MQNPHRARTGKPEVPDCGINANDELDKHIGGLYRVGLQVVSIKSNGETVRIPDWYWRETWKAMHETWKVKNSMGHAHTGTKSSGVQADSAGVSGRAGEKQNTCTGYGL